MGITGYEMVATEVWAHKHINHSNKIQRDATHRLENHGSLSIWLTAFLLSHGPRRLFFMTAFSRGDGRNFSHNWKRHLFQPQSGSRYITWFGALRPLISTSTKQFPSWPCVHLVAELLRADQTVQICPGPLRTRWCLQDSYVGLYLQ